MRGRLGPVLASEWTKLTSTPLLRVSVGMGYGLSVGLTALLAMAMASAMRTCAQPGMDCAAPPLRPDALVSTAGLMGDGTFGPGLAVLMAFAALVVSTDHRHGTIGTTFMVTPRRSLVFLAKLTIAVAVAFVVGLAAVVSSAAAFAALGGMATDGFEPLSDLAFRVYATVPIVTALSAAIAVSVATLARNSVAAVVTVIVWPSVGERLLIALPDVGAQIAPAMPFVNARTFMGLATGDMPWGWQASRVYFLVVAVAMAVLAAQLQERSDLRLP